MTAKESKIPDASVCIWINQIQYEIFTAFRHLSRRWIITAHFCERMNEKRKKCVCDRDESEKSGWGLVYVHICIEPSGPVLKVYVFAYGNKFPFLFFFCSKTATASNPMQWTIMATTKNIERTKCFAYSSLNFCYSCWWCRSMKIHSRQKKTRKRE